MSEKKKNEKNPQKKSPACIVKSELIGHENKKQ